MQTLSAPPFVSFPKMARLSREIVITEKIDGTNAQIMITEDGGFFTGSRNRWITPDDDNFGFSRWAHDNKEDLMQLGVGRHFGEWWGKGIQRGYDLSEKVFSLFNTLRWCEYWKTPLDKQQRAPECCFVVPTLYRGEFSEACIEETLWKLGEYGSRAAKGFPQPEGIVIYHIAAGVGFKKTLENDESPKSVV